MLDIALNNERDVYTNGANDLALVDGFEQLNQHIMLYADTAIRQFVSSRVTGRTIGQLEESVREALASSPRVSSVSSVSVTEYNHETNAVFVEARYNADESGVFELTI